jgi:hypothetical protein
MRDKLLCLFFTVSGLLFAPGSGALTGVVTDPTGAVIPAAAVKLTNVAMAVSSGTTTNGAGVYTFPGAQIFSYELRVESAGFKTRVQTNIVIETGQTVRLDVTLEVGAAQDSAPPGDTTDASITDGVLKVMPLRDWQNDKLLALTASKSAQIGWFPLSC